MRAAALALALALGLACAAPGPAPKPAPGAGYNRRELPPEPGLFTGPDGVWTIYRNDEDRPEGGRPRIPELEQGPER
jgi:hypothetical protein